MTFACRANCAFTRGPRLVAALGPCGLTAGAARRIAVNHASAGGASVHWNSGLACGS